MQCTKNEIEDGQVKDATQTLATKRKFQIS